MENTVALCPNCHRRMHVLDRSQDRHNILWRGSVEQKVLEPESLNRRGYTKCPLCLGKGLLV
ncbi:hypothetical protein [Tunturiibacter gelidiferens]|uniref:hypothetical protein n=1 Tax=Tunturiibacter gelidiferens TaxID=3069689 RepID=UPI003D9BAFA5